MSHLPEWRVRQREHLVGCQHYYQSQGDLSSTHFQVPSMEEACSCPVLLSGILSFIWGDVTMCMTSFHASLSCQLFPGSGEDVLNYLGICETGFHRKVVRCYPHRAL